MDYKNGKIYTIRSHQTNDIYIGSTTQPLTKRLSQHKRNMSNYKKGKRQGKTTSFKILELNDAYIELLELFPCVCKAELHKREGELIRSINCVNKRIEGRTDKQYRDDNKEKIKQYRLANIEQYKTRDKAYYNKNKINILAKSKLLYQKEKLTLAQKINCPCGKIVSKSGLKAHEKTIRHKKIMKT